MYTLVSELTGEVAYSVGINVTQILPGPKPRYHIAARDADRER